MHPVIITDDLLDASLLIQDPAARVRRIALGGDPLVPVVMRGGARLERNPSGPGVFPRRLIEVAVDRQEHQSFGPLVSLDRVRLGAFARGADEPGRSSIMPILSFF